MDAPQYYQYQYTATVSADPDRTSSRRIAYGDLDGDGELSTFTRDGVVRNGEIVLSPAIAETERRRMSDGLR